jgi:thiol:disulfide interchange protein
MQEPAVQPTPDSPSIEPAPSVLKRFRALVGRHERWIWIGIFALVLFMRWPMLKGYYFKVAGVAAPATSIAWRTDFDAALAEARRDGKYLLVDFSADWCPPCIAMKHDVWPDPEVARALANGYVPLLIDTDKNGVVPERYGVTGIPTVLVLDDTGKVLREGAFFTASGMVDFLSEK